MLKTDVDRLLEILEGHKEISVKDAAIQLNTDIKQIEKLSEFLEEEGILVIDYKLAKAYLKLSEEPKEKAKIEKEKEPSVVIENRIIWKKVIEEKQLQNKLISILDKLVSIIPSKVVDERVLDLILKMYLKLIEKAKKIKMDKDFMDKCGRFNELFYFKKFLISMERYKIKRSEINRLDALRDYDNFNKTIKILDEKYNFKPDNNIINKIEQIKNEI